MLALREGRLVDACKNEQACIPLETGDGLVELARIHPRAYLRKDSHQFPRAYNVSNPQRGGGAGRVTRVEVISDWWAKRPSKIIVTDATGDLVLAVREWPKMDEMICGNDGKSKCSCKYSAERRGVEREGYTATQHHAHPQLDSLLHHIIRPTACIRSLALLLLLTHIIHQPAHSPTHPLTHSLTPFIHLARPLALPLAFPHPPPSRAPAAHRSLLTTTDPDNGKGSATSHMVVDVPMLVGCRRTDGSIFTNDKLRAMYAQDPTQNMCGPSGCSGCPLVADDETGKQQGGGVQVIVDATVADGNPDIILTSLVTYTGYEKAAAAVAPKAYCHSDPKNPRFFIAKVTDVPGWKWGEQCFTGAVLGAANKVEEKVAGVGSYGGSCTCPNGQTYQVGDNNDSCGSMACYGGVKGACESESETKVAHSRAGRKVTCGKKDAPVAALCVDTRGSGSGAHGSDTRGTYANGVSTQCEYYKNKNECGLWGGACQKTCGQCGKTYCLPRGEWKSDKCVRRERSGEREKRRKVSSRHPVVLYLLSIQSLCWVYHHLY